MLLFLEDIGEEVARLIIAIFVSFTYFYYSDNFIVVCSLHFLLFRF